MAVCAALKRNFAVPNDAGRAAPVVVVGTVGGFSAALVNVVTNSLWWVGSRPALAFLRHGGPPLPSRLAGRAGDRRGTARPPRAGAGARRANGCRRGGARG